MSLSEKIYKSLRDDITYGKLSPGQKFTETELTHKFKVSRSPIREALYKLASEGLIVFDGKKNKKISVAKLSIKEVDEIYSIRAFLEGYATRLFAEKATAENVNYLQELNHNLEKAAQTDDIKNWINNNTKFHEYIVKNCGNNNLISILDVLKRKIYRYKYIILTVHGRFESYLNDHRGILKGCRHNDGPLAQRNMERHLKRIRDVLIELLNILPH